MPTGRTITDALADSLPLVIASARETREYEGNASNLVEKQTLGEGVGLTWNEITLAKLTATAVTETTILNNPQQFSDTLFSITPTVVGIHTFISDRVAKRISKKVYARMGSLAQNAIQRKADLDVIAVFDGATVSQPGAGNTLSSGVLSAMIAQIRGNTTEPGIGEAFFVGHSYQIKDLRDELAGGIGTYPIPEGISARVYRDGYRGMTVDGVRIFADDNMTIDGSADTKGGLFVKPAIVKVQGRSPWVRRREEPDIGGGGNSVWLYDEYAIGERSAGNWLKEIYSDATAPTG